MGTANGIHGGHVLICTLALRHAFDIHECYTTREVKGRGK